MDHHTGSGLRQVDEITPIPEGIGVISAQASFSSARDEVIQDMASNLPFAGRNEMDELYKELYQLRKRVRELEKNKQKKQHRNNVIIYIMTTKSTISVDHILSKLAEESKAAQSRMDKASSVLLDSLDTEIAVTPYDVVYREDRVSLKHYKPKGPVRLKKPMLIVYALINRETMLDLQPGRSVVETLLEQGIELYMIDWGYPTKMDRFLTIDDDVNGYMDNIVDFILERHKINSLNLMGICMDGAFSIMYAAMHPEKINTLITTVTPSNFDTEQGLLHVWMKNIDANSIVDTYGNLSGDTLNFIFLLLNPARLMIDKYVGFMEHMDNKPFVENFIRMEK